MIDYLPCLLTGAAITCLTIVSAAGLVLANMTRQAWIAFDQWIHCLVLDDAMADETFSARCWREYVVAEYGTSSFRRWERWVRVVDWMFCDGHCREAYYSELKRTHLPKDYQNAAS